MEIKVLNRDELLTLLNRWLRPAAINDYCPNGLQIEGVEVVKKIATGVTASQAFIDAAIQQGADTLMVHHGYFWKGESPVITGMKYKRIQSILSNQINLIAYHLPLDVHPEFGNNVALIKRIQEAAGGRVSSTCIQPISTELPEGIVMQSQLSEVKAGAEFATLLEKVVQRPLVASVIHETPISSFAVCTGGGQGFIEAAVNAGVDAFITGEVSEQTIHIARENNIHFFAAGHHATERYGVYELGKQLEKHTSLAVEFIDIDNPA